MINVVDVSHHYGIRPVLRHVNCSEECGVDCSLPQLLQRRCSSLKVS